MPSQLVDRFVLPTSIGRLVVLADGAVELQATAVRDNDVDFKVVSGGPIGDHKGINLPGVDLDIPALTDKDRADLEAAYEQITTASKQGKPGEGLEYIQNGRIFIGFEVDDQLLPYMVEKYGADCWVYASDIPHAHRKPDSAKHVLRRSDRFEGGTPLTYILGLSLITTDGDGWLAKRRMMQPVFHRNNIAAMSGKMQAAGAFVGQAKKKNPNANPGRVRELCLEIIAKLP